jgi:serine/threonine protein kinase
VDVAVFFDNLEQSRLLADDDFARLRRRFDAETTTEQIATTLQKDGILTFFQARQLLDGRGRQLVLGQYRLLAELGRGGFGKVYKARHVFMDRIVALKLIAPGLVENERARNWFRREVLAATQFDHPNIVRAFDANDVDGQLFLVLEFVDGTDLERLVRHRGPLAPLTAIEIIRQAAFGLGHAHQKGVVHRDIKPANLLLSGVDAASAGNPIVKLTDFGLSRLHHEAHGQTLSGLKERGVVGTPEFISPEQARDVHSVDHRSDLYSLGCTWYLAVTGRPPFRSSTHMETVVQHLEATPMRPEVFRPDLPGAIGDALLRLLAKDPADRFQSADELIEKLDALAVEIAHSPVALAEGVRSSCGMPEAQSETLNSAADRSVDARTLPEASTHAPPPCEGPLEIDAELRRRWSRWLTFLDAIHDVAPKGAEAERRYALAHAAFLELCRERRPTVNEATRRVLRQMEALVEPWVSLECISRSDFETRNSLLAQSRDFDQRVFGGTCDLGTPWWFRAVTILLMIGIVAAAWSPLQLKWARAGSIRSFVAQNYPFGLTVLLLLASPLAVEWLMRKLRRAWLDAKRNL